MNPYILGGGVAASTFCASSTATSKGSTGLLCEDFDLTVGGTECASGYSSNCRAAWTVDKSTPDYDYKSSISGENSLYLAGCGTSDDVRTTRTFTPTDGQPQEAYFEFILTDDGTAPGDFILFTFRRNTSNYCQIDLLANKKLRVTVSGGSSVDTVGTITEDVHTYVWVKYTKENPDAALNGFCSVAFNTIASRPTSGHDNYAESTGGTESYDATGVWLLGEYTSASSCNNVIIDNVFVDDATIGDTP